MVPITVVSKNGEINSDKNIVYNRDKGYAGIKLDVGDSLFVFVHFEYQKEVVDLMSDNGKSEYFEAKINHEFKWEQYSDNSNYESTTFDEWCFFGC